MISNPITDRKYIFSGNSQNDNKVITPNMGLTITVVIFCLVGPFWLFYRLIKTIARMGGLVTDRSVQATE